MIGERGRALARAAAVRIARLLLVLLIVALGIFLLLDLLPGNPAIAILGTDATTAQVERLNAHLGFGDPLPERFGNWLGNVVQGDLGTSFRTNQPVADAITERLPVTVQLAIMAQLIALVVSVPLGILAAYREGGALDRMTRAMSSGFISLPPFVVALMLVWVLSITLSLFPVTGWVRISDDLFGNLRSAFLPALSLAVTEIAIYTQLLRSDMARTLQEDYITAARARGLPTHHVLVRHALRPSSFSLITLAGLNFGRLFGGTVVIEMLFGLPGLGQLLIQSIQAGDYLMLQGAVLFIATVYVALNATVDLIYLWLDPRVRRGRI